MTLYAGNSLTGAIYKGSQLICSSSGGGDKYSLLQRIQDDSNNDVGTVTGFFIDDEDKEYAVVCLDAQYRLANCKLLSTTVSITDLPNYVNIHTGAAWGMGTYSATKNTSIIKNFCDNSEYTSQAVEHCMSTNFLINGTRYYSQIPNIYELLIIFANHKKLNDLDTSKSSAGTSLNWTSVFKITKSSTQMNATNTWIINPYSNTEMRMHGSGKATDQFLCPVLELPM